MVWMITAVVKKRIASRFNLDLSLSHSKRLMNDVRLALDGFKNNKIYYGDTDSVYIHEND